MVHFPNFRNTERDFEQFTRSGDSGVIFEPEFSYLRLPVECALGNEVLHLQVGRMGALKYRLLDHGSKVGSVEESPDVPGIYSVLCRDFFKRLFWVLDKLRSPELSLSDGLNQCRIRSSATCCDFFSGSPVNDLGPATAGLE